MNRLDCILVDDESVVVSGLFGPHHFPVHSHAEYAVCVVDKGVQTFTTSRDNGSLNSRCCALLNPEQLHSGQNADPFGWHQFVLFFSIKAAENFCRDNGIKNTHMTFRTSICDHAPTAAWVTESVRMMAESNDSLQRQSIFQETMAALSILSDSRASASVKAGYLRKAEEMMTDAPEYPHSLDSLAQAAGMSKFHFLRSFRDMTGMTPHAYLTQLRLAKAFSLLKGTQMPVTDIAVECGFADQPHFIRCFRRMWGTTPGKVKRK